jgi:rubredoxin
MSAVIARQWQCYFCAHVYDEAAGDPEHGIAPGTAWEDVPDDWCCPECGATKSDFAVVEQV